MAGGCLKRFELISSHSCDATVFVRYYGVRKGQVAGLWVDTRGRRRAGAWETAGGFANLLFVVTDTRVQ